MKRKFTGLVILIIIGVLSGCGNATNTVNKPCKNNVDTYIVSGDVSFLPLSYEHIKNGNINGVCITQYVNVNNKTIWVAYSQFQSGYGLSFTQEFDKDGNPVLYDGDIEALKQKFNVDE